MADPDDLVPPLVALLTPWAAGMRVTADGPDGYSLDTEHVLENGQRLFFAAVRRGKRYVSFYLMPVYVFPELLAGISPALRKRMQGKSCFNFTRAEPALLAELAELVARGHERYRAAGYLAAG